MIKNLNFTDSYFRYLLSLILFLLYFIFQNSIIKNIILFLFLFFLSTALFNFCPIYYLFNIKIKKEVLNEEIKEDIKKEVKGKPQIDKKRKNLLKNKYSKKE